MNWYDGGQHSIGAHSDDERGLVPNAPIFAVSWGSHRRMSFDNRATCDITIAATCFFMRSLQLVLFFVSLKDLPSDSQKARCRQEGENKL